MITHAIDENSLAADLPSASISSVRPLHVITGMLRGGAEKVAIQLSVGRGEPAGIAWLKGPCAWDETLAGTGVPLFPLTMHGFRQLPLAVKELTGIIRNFRPDVVHTHLIHAHLVGRWAARRAGGVPVVSTEHNMRVRSRRSDALLDLLDRRSSRQAAAICAISEAVRSRCLREGYRPETLHLVRNGVSIPSSSPPAPRNVRPVIVMVGRLRAVKGADLFVRTLGLLPEVQGILVGDGEERDRIEALIQVLPSPHRLKWERGGDALAAMAQADVVVVPSRQEGLGLVALEAMSLGRPVVATCVGGLTEVVEGGVTGMLVAPESPEALADAVSTLLKDEPRRAAMGRAGRLRVEQQFSLERMVEEYQKIYCSVSK